jgi:hypothetical protein
MTSVSLDRQTAKILALWTVLLLLLVACVYGIGRANIQYAQKNPGGPDFLVAWEGMRSVVRGESPYSDATALRIQDRMYGRPAIPGENQLRVPYPIYALLFLAPFYLTSDFSVARGIWMTVVEFATIGFALLSVRLSGKIWRRWQLTLFLIFSVLWYLGLRAIINGNVVILVSLFFCLALFCMDKKWDWAAGVALGCATMKPQVAIFPLACCFLWALFARRYRVIASFLATLSFFVVIGMLILPSWLFDDWREVSQYPSYNLPGNPESSLRAIFGAPGSWAGIAISLGALALMIFLWTRLRKADAGAFVGIFMLTLILAPLSGLQTDAGNEYILLLPIAYLMLPERNNRSGFPYRFLFLLSVLFLGLWGLFIATIKWLDQPIQHPIMLFPLPVFLLLVIGLDWIRKKRKPEIAVGDRRTSVADLSERVKQ